MEENIAGIQAALDYLSLRVGFGTKHYQFNSSSIVTATQYNGDKQDLVQNAAKHSIAVGQHVQALVRALLWAGNTRCSGGRHFRTLSLRASRSAPTQKKTSKR